MSQIARVISVYGRASQKIYTSLDVTLNDLNKPLMDFLRAHNVPVASSCQGDGQCLKCVDAQDIATCQITVSEFLANYGEEVHFHYL